MSKFKLFVENFLIYGLGGIISKVIPLIMVPIVTHLMPNSTYFGLSDLSNTLVSFASALAIMGMYDAMYRMFFEKDDEDFKKSVCSTAFIFTILTSLFIFIVLLLAKGMIAEFFFGNKEYGYLVYISAMATLVGATNSIISAPTRMQNKRKIFLITNMVSSVLSYSISIPLLIKGYYVIALPFAAMISGLTMEISFAVLNYKWFSLKKVDYTLLKQLLVIALPLLPNFLIYWIFNSSDRIMITNMIGIDAAGIYSVGSKLGHASQLIYTAFAGGWQYFAFSTMNENDQVKSNSMIFEYLGVISFVSGIFISACSYCLFDLLFPQEYISGYIVAPYLFLAPLLQMLYQVACNQFLVIKKTWPNMLILSIGAITNIGINFALIPELGIEGAAIATLIGYALSDIIVVLVLKNMKLMEVSPRFLFVTVIMVCYFVTWRLFFSRNIFVSSVCGLLVVVSYLILYKNDLCELIIAVKNSKKK